MACQYVSIWDRGCGGILPLLVTDGAAGGLERIAIFVGIVEPTVLSGEEEGTVAGLDSAGIAVNRAVAALVHVNGEGLNANVLHALRTAIHCLGIHADRLGIGPIRCASPVVGT